MTKSTPKSTPTRIDFARWGTAPETRQCRHILASGLRCRRWSVRAHQVCQGHSRRQIPSRRSGSN